MPPGYNNPEHLKGRKKNGSGFFLTINSNKTFEAIGGEEGVANFKHAIMNLFANSKDLAKIISFKAYKGANRPEMDMAPLEAVEKYLQLPVAMEGVIERNGKNAKPLIHAHIIVGIVHWTFIHLNVQAAMKYFKDRLGYPVRFQIGSETNNGIYRQLPTPEEVANAMRYAGKNLRIDGDYFNGNQEYTVAQFESRYGAIEPGEDDFDISDEENEN